MKLENELTQKLAILLSNYSHSDNGSDFLKKAIDFIKNGADINTKDEFGWTTLTLACDIGCIDSVRLLVEQGAKVNIKDKHEWTPLLLSLKHKNLELIELLL